MHPGGSNAIFYLPREKGSGGGGGRGLRSVEMENKPTKIKGAVRICCYAMTYCLMWDAYIVDAVPPLYCLVKPRPVYESDDKLIGTCQFLHIMKMWRPNRQLQDQADHYTRNELSVVQQQREEKPREDCIGCPPPKLEIKTYSSSLVTKWNNTTKSLMHLRVFFSSIKI